jgi:hypothetical protein
MQNATRRFGGNILTRALDVLDIPRALVVSGINETIDLVQDDEDDTPSFKQFLDQAGLWPGEVEGSATQNESQHIGFGDIVEEAGPNLHPWLKRTLGLIGDIALDPLTYATFGATAAAQGVGKAGGRVGRHLSRNEVLSRITTAMDRGDLAEDAGRAAINRIQRLRTSQAIPQEVADIAGVRRGISFGVRQARLNVPGSARAMEATAEALVPLRQARLTKWANRHMFEGVWEALEVVPGLRKLAASGPDGPYQAFRMRQAWQRAKDVSEEFLSGSRKNITDLYKRFRKVDEQLIRSAMKGTPAEANTDVYQEILRVAEDARIGAIERIGHGMDIKDINIPTFAKHIENLAAKDPNFNPWGALDTYVQNLSIEVNKANLLNKLEEVGLVGLFDRKGYDEYVRQQQRLMNQAAGAAALRDAAIVTAREARRGAQEAAERLRSGGIEESAAIAKGEALAAKKQAQTAREAARQVRQQLDRAEKVLRTAFRAALDTEANPATIEALISRFRNAKWINDPDIRRQVEDTVHVVLDEEVGFDVAAAATRELGMADIENARQLTNIARKLRRAKGKAREALEHEQLIRQQAEALYKQADNEIRLNLKTMGRLEAAAHQANATALKYHENYKGVVRQMKYDKDMAEAAGDLADRAWHELVNYAPGRFASDDVAEALVAMRKTFRPAQVSKLLRGFDRFMSSWKAYALLSLGYHIRNTMGGWFNNDLAGVIARDYTDYRRAVSQMGKDADIEKITDPVIREAFNSVQHKAVTSEMHVRDMTDALAYAIGRKGRPGLFSRTLRGAKYDPTALEFKPLEWNKRMATRVEHMLRSVLFVRTYRNTGSLDEAAASVRRYHFDYSELSSFEQDVMRRVIPFYTWSRKNFPLQIENVMRQPGKYTRFLHIKRNMELGTDKDDDQWVPKYFNDIMAIRFPFTMNGEGVYINKDLPFVSASEFLDPRSALSSLTPVIKTPLEMIAGRQFYTDIPFNGRLVEAPGAWKPLMAAMYAARGLPWLPRVERANGEFYIEDRGAYAVEQMMPLFGRIRRVAPTEDKYQTRHLANVLSILGGIGFRTVDEPAQYGEINRRIEILEKLLSDYTQLGGEIPDAT